MPLRFRRVARKSRRIEISPRRAEIAAYRNQDCANLTIHVGNLNDLALGQAYDVVTLIGVLEYAIRSSPILSLSSVNGNPLTPASCPSMSIMPGTALRPTASVRQSMSRRGGGPGRRTVEKFTRSDAARPHLRAIRTSRRISCRGSVCGRWKNDVLYAVLLTVDRRMLYNESKGGWR